MRNISQNVGESETTNAQIVQSQHLKSNPQQIRVVRMNELSKRLGLAKSTLYKMLAENKFPRGFSINGGKATGWLSTTIDQFLEDRAESASGGQ